MFIKLHKTVSIIILAVFIITSVKSPAYAQMADDQMPRLPIPGSMVRLSTEFTPAHLQGITIHPDNALQFDFLIHRGDQVLTVDEKKQEYKRLVKYFLASLTIPDEDQWVNLSPYENNRIIKDDFGKTEMGRDLLAEDYMLKQITSSLIYPEEGLGKKFWDKVYARAWNEYHTSNIPVNTFNKVWIVPDQALVYESGNTAYILKSHLKVMLEEDYLSLQKHAAPINHSIASQVIREIILPELEKEVNEGKNFATLRQMYSGMILATWYKKALKESLLGRIYVDKARVKGVDQDPKSNEIIYQRYLKAFKKGVFNYIKEDIDKYTNEAIPRKYFSGGFARGKADLAVISQENLPRGIDPEVLNPQHLDRATVNLDAAMTADQRSALVVNDYDSKALSITLENMGFRVLTATTLEQLEQIKSQNRGAIDLIVVNSNRVHDRSWGVPLNDILDTGRSEYHQQIPVLAIDANDRTIYESALIPITAFLPSANLFPRLKAKIVEIFGEDERVRSSRRGFLFGAAATLGTTLMAAGVVYYIWNHGAQEKVVISVGDTGTYIYSLSVSGIDIVEPTPIKVKVISIKEDGDPNYLDVTFVTSSPGKGKLGNFTQTVRVEKDKPIPGFTPDIKKKESNDKAMTTVESVIGQMMMPGRVGISIFKFEQMRDKINDYLRSDRDSATKLILDILGGVPDERVFYDPLIDNNNGEKTEIQIDNLKIVMKKGYEKFYSGDRWRVTRKNIDFTINNNGEEVYTTTDVFYHTLKQWVFLKEHHLDNFVTMAGKALQDEVFTNTEIKLLGPQFFHGHGEKKDHMLNDVLGIVQAVTKPEGNAYQIVVLGQRTDAAMTVSTIDRASVSGDATKGGIDFNAANMNMQIRRDGLGVPLPLVQQDMAQLRAIQGFDPEIIDIRPAGRVPIISELQAKMHASSV